jgi:LPXTG-site transpeptidase (sortase) family protein
MVILGLLLAGVSAGGIAHYEMTPTPVLGHADPHLSGPTAVVQRALSGSDGLIAALPGDTGAPAEAATPAEVKGAAPRSGLWIELPGLSIALPIEKGDGSDKIPQWKALVFPGTSWPGEPGNSYVYAHGYWEMFGPLLYAQPGDLAYLHNYDTGSVLNMRVSRVVGRVAYNDSRWLAIKTAAPTVTLQTCVDYNPKGDRYIVQLT